MSDAAFAPPTQGILAHRVDGAGAPLVLLNGGLMSMSAWDAVAAALGTRHFVVRCDFRGQLLSLGPPPAQTEVLLVRRQQLAAPPPAWFRGVEALLDALEGLDLRPDLARVRCPALVLGAELDRTFPLQWSRALAASLSSATLEVVPGAGHAIVVEAPDRVGRILESFLARVSGEGVPA